jgi:hypothetical protein
VAIWYIFPRFGILNTEKSGNPVPRSRDPDTWFTANLWNVAMIDYFSFNVVKPAPIIDCPCCQNTADTNQARKIRKNDPAMGPVL